MIERRDGISSEGRGRERSTEYWVLVTGYVFTGNGVLGMAYWARDTGHGMMARDTGHGMMGTGYRTGYWTRGTGTGFRVIFGYLKSFMIAWTDVFTRSLTCFDPLDPFHTAGLNVQASIRDQRGVPIPH